MPVLHALPASCSQVLVVQPGQTLATIAAAAFGRQDAVANIIAATNTQAAVDSTYTVITDPNAVEAGWKICVPTITDPDESRPARPANAKAATKANLLSSKPKVKQAAVALEGNDKLLQSLIARRSSNDGVYPLSIDYLRRQSYPGSPLTIVKQLPGGSNYSEYLVSYRSEGLTLYAVMTVPSGEKPATGWPVIVFVHGYIDPATYSPTERYAAYVDAIASHGYIVLRPDLRGHGESHGEAFGAYGDPGYTIDVLNAVASIKQYADADPRHIGMWGHSMGGYITARVMVVSHDIKAGVIWAGVVAPYSELIAQWGSADSTIAEGELPVAKVLTSAYGEPQQNPGFWDSLSTTSYLNELSGPIQLHHGTADTEVPIQFSNLFYSDLIKAGQLAEYYVYAGDDHNISVNFDVAMRRSLEFFDTHVKGSTLDFAEGQTVDTLQLEP